MAFWVRGVKQSRLSLLHQIRRIHSRSSLVSFPLHRIRSINQPGGEVPDWGISRRPAEFRESARFYAAPAKFQKKKDEEEEGKSGPRLNGEITGHTVRLVISDDEHKIISLRDAFQRAQKLGLDLVEVNRKADPPVCKIMDYHKEKYLKEVKVKELTKSKAKIKSDFKEIKITTKTEQKDLEIKAKNVIRLMESGYRVKCTAEGRDNEDLGGKLASLCALLEDVAIVESGPILERKQAYTVLRHKKFGQPKKSVKKTVVSEDSFTDQQTIMDEDSDNPKQVANPNASLPGEDITKKKTTRSESGKADSGRTSQSLSPPPLPQRSAINEDMHFKNTYPSRFPESRPTIGAPRNAADGSGSYKGRFPRQEIRFTDDSPPQNVVDGFRRVSPRFSPPIDASIRQPNFNNPTSNRMGTDVKGNVDRNSPGPPDPNFRSRNPHRSAIPQSNFNESNTQRETRPNDSKIRNSRPSLYGNIGHQQFVAYPSTSYLNSRDGRTNFQHGRVESDNNPESGGRSPSTTFDERPEPEKKFGIFSKR